MSQIEKFYRPTPMQEHVVPYKTYIVGKEKNFKFQQYNIVHGKYLLTFSFLTKSGILLVLVYEIPERSTYKAFASTVSLKNLKDIFLK